MSAQGSIRSYMYLVFKLDCCISHVILVEHVCLGNYELFVLSLMFTMFYVFIQSGSAVCFGSHMLCVKMEKKYV